LQSCRDGDKGLDLPLNSPVLAVFTTAYPLGTALVYSTLSVLPDNVK
jgi:hypothetical protein